MSKWIDETSAILELPTEEDAKLLTEAEGLECSVTLLEKFALGASMSSSIPAKRLKPEVENDTQIAVSTT